MTNEGIYILVYFVSILISSSASILIIKMKQMSLLSITCVIQGLLLDIWIFSDLFFNYFSKDLFFNIKYICIIFSPVIYLIISIAFVINPKRKVYFLFLFCVPITSTIIFLTNSYHHLFYTDLVRKITIDHYGPYFYIHAFYSYSCIIVAIILFLRFSFEQSGLFSKQSSSILLAVLLPFIVNVIITIKNLSFNIDLTAICFIFSYICIFYAIFKLNLIKISPIATKIIKDLISDSYVILAPDFEIIEFNNSFKNTLKGMSQLNSGDNFLEKLENSDLKIYCNQLIESVNDIKINKKSLMVELNYNEKYFDLEMSPIKSDTDKVIGVVILFRDITEHKNNITLLEKNQKQFLENERLHSVCNLIGSIAHNLKTPIMSISLAAESLQSLAKEYDDSIEISSVTKEDHHEIAKELIELISKIKPQCSYMSNVISSVKQQAIQFNNAVITPFKIGDLVTDVEILMNNMLKHNNCKLVVQNYTENGTSINGDLTCLIQIINNLIQNSIEAYGSKNGTITLTIKKTENNILFSITDHACGMPIEIQNRLFCDMVTTKGEYGTGLGILMSYSTITGKFGGNMWFDSVEGKGTTFYFTIPLWLYKTK